VSTTAEIVRDVSRLVSHLDELLQTETARQAPAIAEQLGARPQFDAGVSGMQTIVDRIATGVRAVRHAAVDADALVALLGIVPPVVGGIAGIVRQSGETLAQMGLGLGDLDTVGKQMAMPIERVSTVLEKSEAAAEAIVSLAAPAELRRLAAALAALSQQLRTLKSPGAAAPGQRQ
jgi:methyl-accepting chemotaxis protein